MKSNNWSTVALITLLAIPVTAGALQSDRQQSLEVRADSTNGTLGDGITNLIGNVDIRQGSLRIVADEAEVEKSDGKVRQLTLRGAPARLEQEIEEQGEVRARASKITYEVSSGIVTLTGDADVDHPQYQIRGDQLKYDLNVQHFRGESDAEGNGRIHILLEPELAPDLQGANGEESGSGSENEIPDDNDADETLPESSDSG